MKTLFEKLGGTYREENGHLVAELELPEQTNYQIGKYGQFYLEYLKKHRRGRYTTLLTEGKLNARLHEIDLEIITTGRAGGLHEPPWGMS